MTFNQRDNISKSRTSELGGTTFEKVVPLNQMENSGSAITSQPEGQLRQKLYLAAQTDNLALSQCPRQLTAVTLMAELALMRLGALLAHTTSTRPPMEAAPLPPAPPPVPSIWLRGTTFQKVVSLSLEIQLLGMLSLWLKVITPTPSFD